MLQTAMHISVKICRVAHDGNTLKPRIRMALPPAFNKTSSPSVMEQCQDSKDNSSMANLFTVVEMNSGRTDELLAGNGQHTPFPPRCNHSTDVTQCHSTREYINRNYQLHQHDVIHYTSGSRGLIIYCNARQCLGQTESDYIQTGGNNDSGIVRLRPSMPLTI